LPDSCSTREQVGSPHNRQLTPQCVFVIVILSFSLVYFLNYFG